MTYITQYFNKNVDKYNNTLLRDYGEKGGLKKFVSPISKENPIKDEVKFKKLVGKMFVALGGPTIQDTCFELLHKTRKVEGVEMGLPYSEILPKVLKVHFYADTSLKCLQWYQTNGEKKFGITDLPYQRIRSSNKGETQINPIAPQNKDKVKVQPTKS